MPKKVLLPVMPSERFYDAVVAAADVITQEGGTITFLFTQVRPPAQAYDRLEAQHGGELDVQVEVEDTPDEDTLDEWQDLMSSALDTARDLLYERGLRDEQTDVVFADSSRTPAENIASEAAGGGYDLVVLARGYFIQMPISPGEDVIDVAAAVQELADEGVQLLVT